MKHYNLLVPKVQELPLACIEGIITLVGLPKEDFILCNHDSQTDLYVSGVSSVEEVPGEYFNYAGKLDLIETYLRKYKA